MVIVTCVGESVYIGCVEIRSDLVVVNSSSNLKVYYMLFQSALGPVAATAAAASDDGDSRLCEKGSLLRNISG